MGPTTTSPHPPSYPHHSTPPPHFFFQRETSFPFRRVLILPADTTTSSSISPGAAAYTIKLHGHRSFGSTPLLTLYHGDIGDASTLSDAEKINGNVLLTARLTGGGIVGMLRGGRQVGEVKTFGKTGAVAGKVEEVPMSAAGEKAKAKEKGKGKERGGGKGRKEVLRVEVAGKRLEIGVEAKVETIVMIEPTTNSGVPTAADVKPGTTESEKRGEPGAGSQPATPSTTWISTLHEIRNSDPVLKTRCYTITVSSSPSSSSEGNEGGDTLLATYRDLVPSMKRYTKDLRWEGDHKGVLEFVRPEEDDTVRNVVVGVLAMVLEREKVKGGREMIPWNMGAGTAAGCGGGGG